MKNNPKLTLLGAGPGDPDLISIKGMKALTKADAVLYDALTHPDLLNYAPKNAPKVFVGKRSGQHSFKQDEINKLIVEYALNYGHVVRLKGGDPFVFGRGQEEIEYVEAFDIPTEVVPGISSSIGVPGLQKIPVTRREDSESFWVITGTTKDLELSKDLTLAAQSSATVIVLMGTKKLALIAETYRNAGRNEMPVAIIQNGSLENEKVVLGTVDTIEKLAADSQIGAPAIIVLGEVVKHHPNFSHAFVETNYLKQ
ncbi:MAG: uroporphyrinogen-III C-methyltransferase [Flavobacteriales bacterium]|nr:uroporphyrinogen-III C-methyltransferase [Flavobacteriales bacterium]